LSGSLALRSLNDGLITLTADLIDLVGNRATQAIRYTNKDTVAPTMSIEPPLFVNRANMNAAIWSGNCSDNGRVLSAAIGTLTGSSICNSNRFTQVIDVSSLPDGNYVFSGSTSDAALNST
jgi:hypothetical protein